MLLEFGARNYFSFKEGFDFSLELNGNCPESISKGKCVANTMGVKGANASGKTNVLKALSFIKYLCTESFSLPPKTEIPFNAFYDSKDSTSLFCRFAIDEIKYLYEIELNNQEILSEELSIDDSEKYVFKREKNEITAVGDKYTEIKELKLRSNVSVISSAHMNEFLSLDVFFKFFVNIITNVTDFGMMNLMLAPSSICKEYSENAQIFSEVKDVLAKADTGIVDVKIRRSMNPQGIIEFFPVFIHDVDGKRFQVPFWHESNGTRNLFYTLYLYFRTLAGGGVLLLDEFDINLHPDILPLLLNLFNDEQKNPHNAQMIFSTHDTSIMDRLGKYRTYLVNKKNNESFGYRLDEIPGDILRNDRPVSTPYRNGKVGGVPKV